MTNTLSKLTFSNFWDLESALQNSLPPYLYPSIHIPSLLHPLALVIVIAIPLCILVMRALTLCSHLKVIVRRLEWARTRVCNKGCYMSLGIHFLYIARCPVGREVVYSKTGREVAYGRWPSDVWPLGTIGYNNFYIAESCLRMGWGNGDSGILCQLPAPERTAF